MLTFVQNPKAWLILARFNPAIKDWQYIKNKIPYEYEDSRFRHACKYLSEGFKFYYAHQVNNLSSAISIKIPPHILLEIKLDPPTIPLVKSL